MKQVLNTERYKYKRIKVRGPDGKVRYSANNGDAVSRTMLGMDLASLVQVMDGNGLEKLRVHTAKNVGYFRLVLGQALRQVILHGGTVTVGDTVVSALDQRVPLPEGYVEEAIVPRGTPAPKVYVSRKPKLTKP